MLAGYRISDNPGLNTVFGKPTILGADKTRLVEVLNMWSTLDPEWSVSQCQCGWRSWINTHLLWCFAIEIWRFFSLCLWLWATPSRCLWLCGRSDYRLCRILQTLKWQTVKKKNKKKKKICSLFTLQCLSWNYGEAEVACKWNVGVLTMIYADDWLTVTS